MYCYHTEGKRAFILEADGTTVCEIVAHGNNSRAAIAHSLVAKLNSRDDLKTALMDLIAGVDLPPGYANMQLLAQAGRDAIDKAL